MKTVTDAADGALVYLGLGANIGDRAGSLRAAVQRLAACLNIDAVSDVYETEPWGFTEQPRFWNLALRGRTKLEPRVLLRDVQQIERDLGRVNTQRLGPRAIDIDVLFYGGITMDDDGLVLPHPGILTRPFVLRPLLDLDPDLRHPVTAVQLADTLAGMDLAPDALVHLGSASDVLQLDIDSAREAGDGG